MTVSDNAIIMFVHQTLSRDLIQKIKFLGWYQVAGGIVGIGLTLGTISGLTTAGWLLILLILTGLVLYCYSIYCGAILLRGRISGLQFSSINQFLQLVNFSIHGYSFKYVSGVFISVGIDLTDSFNVSFNSGISSWKIAIMMDVEPLVLNLNFAALFLILWIDRLKEKVGKEQIRNEKASLVE